MAVRLQRDWIDMLMTSGEMPGRPLVLQHSGELGSERRRPETRSTLAGMRALLPRSMRSVRLSHLALCMVYSRLENTAAGPTAGSVYSQRV